MYSKRENKRTNFSYYRDRKVKLFLPDPVQTLYNIYRYQTLKKRFSDLKGQYHEFNAFYGTFMRQQRTAE